MRILKIMVPKTFCKEVSLMKLLIYETVHCSPLMVTWGQNNRIIKPLFCYRSNITVVQCQFLNDFLLLVKYYFIILKTRLNLERSFYYIKMLTSNIDTKYVWRLLFHIWFNVFKIPEFLIFRKWTGCQNKVLLFFPLPFYQDYLCHYLLFLMIKK